MSGTSTKEKIIYEALKLFSEKSYDSVSVRDISTAVGIRESSLYYYFKNKREIFDAVISDCEKRTEEHFLNLTNPFCSENGGIYSKVSEEKLIMVAISVMNFYMTDEFSRLFRRMLVIGQFSDDRLKSCYRSIFIRQPEEFFTRLFGAMNENGISPRSAARAFYSPLYLIMNESDSIAEALPKIKNHILTFVGLYIKRLK